MLTAMVALHSMMPPRLETQHIAENCCNQAFSPTLRTTTAGRPSTLQCRLPRQTLLHCSSAQPAIQISEMHGNTALGTAVFNSRGRGEVIAQLRAAGADPSACNNHGVSPLALARTIANYNVAQFFADIP